MRPRSKRTRRCAVSSGETYDEFLTRLAQASGIETPTRRDLARLDRQRPRKRSNDDWQHPHDPEARITKMKDGRTHLARRVSFSWGWPATNHLMTTLAATVSFTDPDPRAPA